MFCTLFCYSIGKFFEPPYGTKKPYGHYAHKCVRKLFDYVKSHLARKAEQVPHN